MIISLTSLCLIFGCVQNALVGKSKKNIHADIWIEPFLGMNFVWVPKGCFQMGSFLGKDNETPPHKVCLDGFWISRTEVSQAQYKKIMGTNSSHFKKGGDYPVDHISWYDAKDFILKLNQKTNLLFNLPTEAQWEYAARSQGKDNLYAGRSKLDQLAWYDANSNGETHPVATKAPNDLGIYDMSGNVWEWCEDIYDKDAYSKHCRNNPLMLSGSHKRVVRGGSWYSVPEYTKVFYRHKEDPEDIRVTTGFRLIRTE